MHSMIVMADACREAIAAEEEGRDWEQAYALVVEPHSVLSLIEAVGQQENVISTEEVAAMAQSIRDLSAFIRDQEDGQRDPTRDALLEHASQLVLLAGL